LAVSENTEPKILQMLVVTLKVSATFFLKLGRTTLT